MKLLPLALASALLLLLPAALPETAADTCASMVLENQVCGAVGVWYCIIFGVPQGYPLVPCVYGNVKRALTFEPMP